MRDLRYVDVGRDLGFIAVSMQRRRSGQPVSGLSACPMQFVDQRNAGTAGRRRHVDIEILQTAGFRDLHTPLQSLHIGCRQYRLLLFRIQQSRKDRETADLHVGQLFRFFDQIPELTAGKTAFLPGIEL